MNALFKDAPTGDRSAVASGAAADRDTRSTVLAQAFPLTRGGSLLQAWDGFWVSPGYTLDPPGCVGVSDGMVQPLIGKVLVQIGDQLHKQATDRLL